jgi:hypothetical protein
MSSGASAAIGEDVGVSSPKRASSSQAPRASKRVTAVGSKAVEVLSKAVPLLLKVGAALEKAASLCTPVVALSQQAYAQLYALLEPYGPEEVLKMGAGLGMMFFGGFFITTISVFEAFDQSGRTTLIRNLRLLAEQAEQVRRADARDDELDEDNDGVKDVQQVSAQQLSLRKLLVVVRAADPNVISEALGALYAILLAVTATLQVRFARAVSLGAAIGNALAKTALKLLIPPLKEVVPDDFHKWLPPVTTYVCRLIGVSIAFSLNRVLATVHTAVRGARLATDAFAQWTEKRNMRYLSEGYLDDAAAFLLAALGVYGQLFLWYRLPFIVELVLLPATLLEWLLSFLVSASVASGTASAQQAQGFHDPAATAAAAAVPQQQL